MSNKNIARCVCKSISCKNHKRKEYKCSTKDSLNKITKNSSSQNKPTHKTVLKQNISML